MKILLIFPPLWDINLSPMLSLPTLAGMLKEEGHEVEILDVNSSFMNFILNKDFLNYFDNKIQFYKQQNLNTKYTENWLKNYNSIRQELVNFYDNEAYYKDILKTDNFDEINNYYILINNLTNTIYQLSDIKDLTSDEAFFDNYHNKLVKEIKDKTPDLIGFSANNPFQFLWSKNFAAPLKKVLNSKIILGGSEIFHFETMLNDSTIFENIDALIFGEGETTFKYLCNEEDFETIPGLIWKNKNDNNIYVNTNKNLPILNTIENKNVIKKEIPVKEKYKTSFKFYKPDYNGINFNSYFLPQKVINIESSRGCYWNKCEFCLYSDGIRYKQKNIDDLIEEIKEYVYKYKINKLYFTDSAIHPDYAGEFSRKILENKLNIQYATYLRLDTKFNSELLNLMYSAGLRIGMWGLESGSDRILELYKKGTTSKTNAQILKASSDAGIINFCWIIVKFPKETIQDLLQTKYFLIENNKYINFIQFHSFALYQYSPMAKHLKDFGIDENIFQNNSNTIGYEAPINIEYNANKILGELSKIYQKRIFSYRFLSNAIIALSKIKE